ncbi:E3 ubiquitin-protein ligase FANCL-like [Quillaja saponaria]|uniref:E3 ubiquitin-protein ligase FANCL-like n=1 Tax=Quillaja saponaria TaxID=32244 RepID=A0AAD7L6X3_QUISA|nr:E3 ubiquitin-protein ligase FANCL-like [Quillaja saponaria]
MESTEGTRCRKLAETSAFYRLVYSEIEEIGWKHLVRSAGDLKSLSFRILDNKGRVHIMEIQLDIHYPRFPPSISADVPYIFDLRWSMSSRLRDLVQQFQEHLKKLEDFWSIMDDIDKFLWVVDPKHPSRAMAYRQINIGNDCYIMLSINSRDPRSLPECRFMGADPIVNSLISIWRRNSKRWIKDNPFLENLARVLETQLLRPPDVPKNNQQLECGICYAQFLPVDDELEPKSGSATDYTCDNSKCNRAFHSVCLGDWLRSITTTRQSFNVYFGSCPYCSEPVAVKINSKK